MSVLTLNDVHAALRQASRIDNARSATQRRTLAVGYTLATIISGAAAVSGKTLNPMLKNRELTRFGRAYKGLNALVSASVAAVAVLETVSVDGVELNRRHVTRISTS